MSIYPPVFSVALLPGFDLKPSTEGKRTGAWSRTSPSAPSE